MVRGRSRLWPILGVVMLVLAPSLARADDDPDAEIARRHVDKGERLFKEHEWAKALAEFDAAQLVKPQLSVDLSIGKCYEKLGKNREAFKAFLKVLDATKDPQQEAEARTLVRQLKEISTATPEAKRLEKGQKLFDAREYEKALVDFEAVAKLPTAPPEAALFLAKTLDRLERYADAIAAYQRYIDGKPDPFELDAIKQRVAKLRERVALIDARKRPPSTGTPPIAAAPNVAPRDPAKLPVDEEPTRVAPPKPAPTETTRPTTPTPPPPEVNNVPPPSTGPSEPLLAPPRPLPFWRRHLVPIAVGGGAVVLAVVGLAVSLAVAPGFVNLANTCAPRCDPAQWSGLQTQANAGYAFLGIGAAVALVDVALWLLELKFGRNLGERRAWAAPAAATTGWAF